MKARAFRKRPAVSQRRPLPCREGPVRDCRFRAPSGACLDPVLTSGRCGDYIRYVRGNRQYRRLYARPTDPRTLKQKRWRARFGDASSKYSQSLTDEQQDARIAAGRSCGAGHAWAQSGLLTGQQYSIRKEFTANAESRKQKPAQAEKVPQLQRLTRNTRHKCCNHRGLRDQLRVHTGCIQGATGAWPAGHRAREEGRRQKEEEKTV